MNLSLFVCICARTIKLAHTEEPPEVDCFPYAKKKDFFENIIFPEGVRLAPGVPHLHFLAVSTC